MRTLLIGLTVCAALVSSCASLGTPAPAPLVRKVMERPMSGKKASEPIADSLSRITNRTGTNHMGTDFTSRRQALPVFAVKEGEVMSNSTSQSSSGAATITVFNSDGSVSRYLHVGSSLRAGDVLTIGQPLGLVLLPGQSGFGSTNTGAHLHYEQFLDRISFDRRRFMTTAEVIAQWAD